MTITRTHALIAIVCTAAVAAFVLTYRSARVEPAAPLAASIGELKAAEVTRQPFDPNTMDAHLALTPSNIVWFTNYYRVRNGRDPLKMVDALNRSAYKKSIDLFNYDYFDHSRDHGPRFDDFIDNEHYTFIKAGENLAHGDFKTSREVVEAWMRSEEHRDNILDPTFTEIGVAINHGTLDGVTTEMFVQHFGLPQRYCPAVSQAVKSSIDRTKSDLEDLKRTIQVKEVELGTIHASDGTYGEKVDTYNGLVMNYNQLVQKLEGMVTNYNAQVKKFDDCVRGVVE